MPKVKQKSGQRRHNQSSDEEDVSVAPAASQVTASQTSLTQAEKMLKTAPKKEMDRKVNELVQFFLVMDRKKIPIKRQDINKQVLKEHSKLFPVLVKRAELQLKEVFGIELVELDSKQKSYILVNCFNNDVDKPHQEWNAEDNSRMGLVMIILSLIFMNGNSIQDSALFHALKKLGVDTERPHEVFGDVKKLIMQEFVRQQYLELERIPQSDPQAYNITWGGRAKCETSKSAVLQFVSEIYDVEPNKWTSQFQDVERSERVRDPSNS